MTCKNNCPVCTCKPRMRIENVVLGHIVHHNNETYLRLQGQWFVKSLGSEWLPETSMYSRGLELDFQRLLSQEKEDG
jgi:hypothetical protein